MKIVDSHVHYWEPASAERPWDPAVDLGAPWPVEAILDEAAAAGIDRVVPVTTTITRFDNRYGLEGAQRHPDRVAGVFGRFDLTAPSRRQRLVSFAAQPHILGIRITAIQPAELAWFDDGTLDGFLDEGVDLPLVIQLYAPGNPKKIAAAARAHPNVPIFVDHMGVQPRAADPFAEVWSDVLALKAFPNVWMKISAVPQIAREPYPFPRMERFVRDLCDAFGPDRLIWGSYSPFALKVCTLSQSVAFLRDLSFIDDRDQEKIFGGTLLAAIERSRVRGSTA